MTQAEEVRSAADIVRIVGDYVKLRKVGANYVGLCPFHQEKTPSFSVHPVKQIFHCFGCGVGGDVFKFVMLIENLSFPEALYRVAEKAGVRLRESLRDGEEHAAKRDERSVLYRAHEAAAKYFGAQLSGTAEGRAARAYLADRGLTDEMVGRFRIGYAPSDGQSLNRHVQELGFTPETLEKSGLVVRDAERDRRYDRFRRRIIFPMASESGRIVAFGGRALGDDLPKYLNSPETPIYTKSRVLYNLDRAAPAIRKLDYAVLVEGYMDAIAVASAGVENVVASCGTSLTESHARLLGRYTRRVIVNYDPDSAGVAATDRSLNLLLEEGFEAKVLALPGGLDPDSFIRREGAEAYRARLAAAPTYLDYLTSRAAATHDLSRPEGKVAAVNAVLPYLARVPSPLLRAELASRLAERLRLDERLVSDELKRAATEARREIRPAPEGFSVSRATRAEKELLRAFLERPELADEHLGPLVESGDCEGLVMEPVFRKLLEARRRGEGLEAGRLSEWLEPEEQRLAYECLFEAGEPTGPEHLEDCRRALRLKRVEAERERLQAAIRDAERAQDTARLAELLHAKTRLGKELAEIRSGGKNSRHDANDLV
jgi:DNA primase